MSLKETTAKCTCLMQGHRQAIWDSAGLATTVGLPEIDNEYATLSVDAEFDRLCYLKFIWSISCHLAPPTHPKPARPHCDARR